MERQRGSDGGSRTGLKHGRRLLAPGAMRATRLQLRSGMVRLLGSAPAAPVPIVIDCANGVGGAKAKVLAERLGNLVSFRSAHVPCIRAPPTSAPGPGSHLPHLRLDFAHSAAHICARNGLAPATSAPGLGLPLLPLRPHLRRD